MSHVLGLVSWCDGPPSRGAVALNMPEAFGREFLERGVKGVHLTLLDSILDLTIKRIHIAHCGFKLRYRHFANINEVKLIR